MDTNVSDRSILSKLPGVDKILESEGLRGLRDRISVDHLTMFVRQGVDLVRGDILSGRSRGPDLMTEVLAEVHSVAECFLSPSLKRVVNATGVVLHTNLGRAPLSPEAIDRMASIAAGYTNLELDLETGERGSRTSLVEPLLCQLTGAEAAAVVNNNAAAVLIGLNTLAQGEEAVVSRGQLVEIGGSFRIPDIMERSGAIMVEVGTTNRTHPNDFQGAITERTGLLLSVHPSNYEVVGFTAEVDLKTLVEIGHARDVPTLHDLGAGCLIDTRKLGLGYEPLVSDSVEAGADLVTFSGDKILGGPQCGIIVGKREAVEQVRQNPLMRALRCDKLIYAALEATLRLFINRKTLPEKHPVMRMLGEPLEVVRARADKLLNKVAQVDADVSVVDSDGRVGSGALPSEAVASAAVRIHSDRCSAGRLARMLRSGSLPVLGYIRDEALYLDARTIFDDDISHVAEMLRSALSEGA